MVNHGYGTVPYLWVNRLFCSCRYLVDVRWMQIWKKYVGYDHWDQSSAGQQVPGPVETSSLFAGKLCAMTVMNLLGCSLPYYGHHVCCFAVPDVAKEKLKEHLIEELHYSLVPEAAWQKLIQWYGMAPGSRPIPRKVVWYGLDMKHLKVEIYKLEFKLAVHPKLKEHIIEDFSRGDTVGEYLGLQHWEHMNCPNVHENHNTLTDNHKQNKKHLKAISLIMDIAATSQIAS